jgi:putative transposase
MAINRPNQVWCSDITYIPVQHGYLYLVAIMARHSPPLVRAMARTQGSKFTSLAFTGALKDTGVAISMGGRGRCMDNIFIERLWRSLKYDAVYLHELTDGFVAERVIGGWLDFYNTERPHSSLDDKTQAEAYWRDHLKH